MARIALVAILMFGFALPAAAQYPDRPVTLLAGYPPGGMVDIVTRTLAETMKKRFPKGIVIVNRPGTAGSVAVAEVVRAQPDGYTIVLTPASGLTIRSEERRCRGTAGSTED